MRLWSVTLSDTPLIAILRDVLIAKESPVRYRSHDRDASSLVIPQLSYTPATITSLRHHGHLITYPITNKISPGKCRILRVNNARIAHSYVRHTGFGLLSVCHSVTLSVCRSVTLFVCRSFTLFVSRSVTLFVISSLCPSVCHSVIPFVCPSLHYVHLYVIALPCLSVCNYVTVSVRLFDYTSVSTIALSPEL